MTDASEIDKAVSARKIPVLSPALSSPAAQNPVVRAVQLPIIGRREKNYQIDLQGRVQCYFYFHKVMGFMLASFLIAGISGLTK